MLAAGAAVFKGQAGAQSTYIGRVLAYHPDWYLPLGDPMATAQVGPSGTYQNSPQLGVDPIAQDDSAGKSVGLSGAATSPPHITVGSPLSAASFTIHLLVQLDSITKSKHVLITTGGGPSLGDFSVEVLANGQMRAWSEDGIVREILGTAGDLPQGEAVSVVYQRQSDVAGWSQRVYVNGALKAEDPVQRTWPSLPSQTWYIGAWSTLVDATDGLIAHVAGWNGLLTPTQISDLARGNSVAWAENIDAGAVQAGQSKIVSVRQGGWHGKTPLVASAGDGSLVTTTESGEEITILAGGTTGDDETFSYSFTDANGKTSPSRTVTIDVTAGGGEYITTPEVHGWSPGNTVEQNSDALRAAVADAAANAGSSSTGRGVVEFVPGKTYTLRPSGDANGTGSTYSPCIDLPSNVELRTQGIPNLGGSQARLLMESYASKSGPFYKRAILKVNNRDNVVIRSIILDGNKDTFTNDDLTNGKISFSFGGNGGFHGLALRGCTNTTVLHVESRHNYTDGISIAESEGASQDVEDLLVEDCWFHHNGRQGLNMVRTIMAIPDFDNIIFRRVTFSNQGDSNGLFGQRPGRGVDIESDSNSDNINGITLESCVFRDNLGSSFISNAGGSNNVGLGGGAGCVVDLTHGPDGEYIKIVDCIADNNNDSGIAFVLREGGNIRHLRVTNCVLTGNGSANGLRLSANTSSGSVTGHYTDTILKNNDAGQIFINSDLPATGHEITIEQDGQGVPIVNSGNRQTVTEIA